MAHKHRIASAFRFSPHLTGCCFCAGGRCRVALTRQSIQSRRFVGGAPEDAVELTVVVDEAEDVDGSDDSRSNISHRVGPCCCCWCWCLGCCCCSGGAGLGAAFSLDLRMMTAFLAATASSVSTYFWTRFTCDGGGGGRNRFEFSQPRHWNSTRVGWGGEISN